MTNQSRPLFAVGEEVVLSPGIEFSHYRGEYKVSNIIYPLNQYVDRIHKDNRNSISSTEFGYQLDQIHYNPKRNSEILWAESCLHKKYPPSSQSFSELMNTLKSPEKA